MSTISFPVKTIEEITKKIEEKNKAGMNEAWFFRSHITKLDYDELEKMGCHVKAKYINNIPNFKVSW